MTTCAIFPTGDTNAIITSNHTPIKKGYIARYFKDTGNRSCENDVYVRLEGGGRYLCSLIRKIFLFVISLLNITNICSSKTLRERGIVCLDTLVAAGISLLGIFFVETAGKADAYVKEHMLSWAKSA